MSMRESYHMPGVKYITPQLELVCPEAILASLVFGGRTRARREETVVECMHSLVCDLGVLAEGSVLLVRYRDMAKYDGEAGWFLPDDVLHHLEHPGRAAERIA